MAFSALGKIGLRIRITALSIARRSRLGIWAVLAFAQLGTISTPAQSVQSPEVQLGQIMGTVTDVRGDAVAGATILLTTPDSADRQTTVTPASGFFDFEGVKPGVICQITITANGFAEWTSPAITLQPGEVKLLGSVPLRLATQNTTVTVTASPIEIATEQFKIEQTQRVLGVIPNFYVSYAGDNAAPLTSKMKFQLALKVSYDAVTIAGVALVAGARQATDTPDYQQGLKGYGERFGAVAADGFTDIMIGGAILPSLLHQDPRYFYQGTGTTKSRLLHALSSPFIGRGDNGSWGPNYSSMGGDLTSSAIANLYYPKSDRGAGLVFSQFAIATAERMGASVAQEFVLGRLTRRGGHVKQADPKS
jgi:Carboxypeptidase regulatory-like domain